MKGIKNGSCNRTTCQAPESAVYFNHSTTAWYCAECADKINRMNPERYTLFGHELCTHADSAETAVYFETEY